MELNHIDDAYNRLKVPNEYQVELSPELQNLQKEVVQEVREKDLGES